MPGGSPYTYTSYTLPLLCGVDRGLVITPSNNGGSIKISLVTSNYEIPLIEQNGLNTKIYF